MVVLEPLCDADTVSDVEGITHISRRESNCAWSYLCACIIAYMC